MCFSVFAPKLLLRDVGQSSAHGFGQYTMFVVHRHFAREEKWGEAADAAKSALRMFYVWATQWDNRMPFTAWVSWTRCILLQSSYKELFAPGRGSALSASWNPSACGSPGNPRSR